MPMSEVRQALVDSQEELTSSGVHLALSSEKFAEMQDKGMGIKEASKTLGEIIRMNEGMASTANSTTRNLRLCKSYARESAELVTYATRGDSHELAAEARRGSSYITDKLGSCVAESSFLSDDFDALRLALHEAATLVERIGDRMAKLDERIGEEGTMKGFYTATSQAVTGLIARIDGVK